MSQNPHDDARPEGEQPRYEAPSYQAPQYGAPAEHTPSDSEAVRTSDAADQPAQGADSADAAAQQGGYSAPAYGSQQPAADQDGAAGVQRSGSTAVPASGEGAAPSYSQPTYDASGQGASAQGQPSYGAAGQDQPSYSAQDQQGYGQPGAQQAPSYGQSAEQPSYGQSSAPPYGEQAPSYGSQSSAYGDQQPASPYGHQPSYGSGQQSYEQPSYGSGAPASPYGQQPSAPQYGGGQQSAAPQYGDQQYGGQSGSQAPQYQPAGGGSQAPQYQPSGGNQWAGGAAAGGAASGAAFANAGRLRTLLFASAGLFLLLGIVQVLGRTTRAYALSLQEAAEAAEQFGIDLGGQTAGGLAIGVGNIISWIITLGLYALVLFLLNSKPGAGRIVGIILAILGSLGALGAFISAFNYGWVAILVILVGIAFIAVNVMWIIQAIKAKPAAR